METPFQNNSIFFVDVDKVLPNPFQPRLEFDNAQLESLSESIRMYGVLQPLVVTRKEVFTEEGGMTAQYELIAGERRLRASKLAGMKEVPVVIRSAEQTDQEKLELAIIENLQREDLNPVDRAKAFRLLADDFKLKHAEIGKRVGKSREYVSNSLRLLALPEEMLAALTVKKISEGHARSLLMVGDRPEEQMTLFKEIMLKGLTVRHAEKIARRVAYDKVRKKSRVIDPHVVEVEEEMSEAFGTRVHIERKAVGGKIQIDFFSEDDLVKILEVLKQHEGEFVQDEKDPQAKMNAFIEQSGGLTAATGMVFEKEQAEAQAQETTVQQEVAAEEVVTEAPVADTPTHQSPSFSISEITGSQQESVSSVVEPEIKEEGVVVPIQSEEKSKDAMKPFSYSEVMARPEEPQPEEVISEDVKEAVINESENIQSNPQFVPQARPVENTLEELTIDPINSSQNTYSPNPDQTLSQSSSAQTEQPDSPLGTLPQQEVSLQQNLKTVFEDKNPNQPQGVQAQEVDSFVQNAGAQPQNATSQNLPEVEVFTEQPIQKMYQEERQDLAEEGIEILADNTSVEEVSVPEQVAPIQATDHVAQSAPVSAPQEYTIKEEGISENKIDSENIQVQSILQNAQQPLPVGESVQNIAKTHAEDHAEELYYNLPPSAQKTKLDAPIEVATPHYGDPKDGDEHLYRV